MPEHILVNVGEYLRDRHTSVRYVVSSGSIVESDIPIVREVFKFSIKELWIDNGVVTKIGFLSKRDLEPLRKIVGPDAFYSRWYGSHVVQLDVARGNRYVSVSQLYCQYYPLITGSERGMEQSALRVSGSTTLISELCRLGTVIDRRECTVCQINNYKIFIPDQHAQYRSDIASLFT